MTIDGTIYGIINERRAILLDRQDVAEIGSLGVFGLSQLARIYPVPSVTQILQDHERATWRLRKLPNELMFYFPMISALDRTDSAIDTVLKLLDNNEIVFRRRTSKPQKGAISEARIRISYEPLKMAFDRFCGPLAKEPSIYTHFNGHPLMAIDGVLLNVLDTEANAIFGRSKNQNKRLGVNPQARVVGLVECGTHAMVAAEIGGYDDSEVLLAREVLTKLPENSLLMADRLYIGWRLVKQVLDRGAQLIWRVKSNDREEKFELGERLPDGSYRGIYHPPKDPKSLKDLEGIDMTPIPVRLCAYQLETGGDPFYLVTTLLDEVSAPVTKLAELYMQRWEIELVFSEMKVQLNKNEHTLRSQRPDLVKQEIYGILMMHYAIRSFIFEAAARSKIDPDCISFKGAVKTIDRKLLKSGVFSP